MKARLLSNSEYFQNSMTCGYDYQLAVVEGGKKKKNNLLLALHWAAKNYQIGTFATSINQQKVYCGTSYR